MGWDIFRVKKKRDEPDDDIQIAIKAIEKFAPKKYLQEREMYYYHYRQMSKYLKPLLALLVYVSHTDKKRKNEEVFIQGLFSKLKDFYDVNDQLSIKEATQDYSLKIKLRKLLKIFYDDTSLTGTDIEGYLKKIPDN
ncbi:MAG: hypothetical protein B6I32_00695 [Desulfobacterium sp. 4572_20]|nr:hypothetical protein [Deltaproteobacteria bacterium]OQY17490.1 MAG: hypothetical protein B6I32_00695 [Desulfobacterium sp. 4572_20]RLB21863.1 MAG: hypothetical protein DRG73_07805 [Deltaproteobacteria bacterium]